MRRAVLWVVLGFLLFSAGIVLGAGVYLVTEVSRSFFSLVLELAREASR